MEVNLDPVIDHIQSQNLKALEHEQNAKREAAMSKWQVYILTQQSQYSNCREQCSRVKHMTSNDGSWLRHLNHFTLFVQTIPLLTQSTCG